jgi:multicomponent Na+:H+ antiporter subunit F
MTAPLLIAQGLLLLALLVGLLRVLRGPSEADRMLAAQLLGTTAVALLMLLSLTMGMPRLLDVALVGAILAAVAVVSFVATARGEVRDGDRH